MLSILFPLPRVNSGRSAIGKTSIRPSLLTAAMSALTSLTIFGFKILPPLGMVTTALPALFLVNRSPILPIKP